MKINQDSTKPIYIQIADWLQSEILLGTIAEGEKMYSQYQLAEMFTINPATAAKGINLLAEEGLLIKKRGLGMFVVEGAVAHIQGKRKNETLSALVKELVQEGKQLNLSQSELIHFIEKEWTKGGETR